MTTYKIGYLVGSLASNSNNRNLTKALIKLAPAELTFTEIPIGNLPLYSSDYDGDYPVEGGHSRLPLPPRTDSCSSPPSTTVPFRGP